MTGALIIAGMVVALAIGVWVGLGSPGWKRGLRTDRVVESGRAKRLQRRHIDLLRTQRRR
ncbi:MAG TPA: hypothetical protein VK928_00085 [Longimicrobiales bacterium]|nr:hypothetical protein [Longimicrobiales bacterium]